MLNTTQLNVENSFGTSCDFLQHILQKREDWKLNKTHSGRWRTILESLKGSCDCSPDYLTLLHFCLSNQQSWTYRILLTQCYIPVHSVDIRTKCVLWNLKLTSILLCTCSFAYPLLNLKPKYTKIVNSE